MNNNNININKFIHSKMFMIVMILVLIGLVGGVGTYAWFTWSSTDNTSLTLSIGKIADVTFDTGNDINTNNLAPVFNYTDGEITTFSITNKDTSGTTVSYSVKLNITNISPELANDSLKYKLISNGEEVGSGDFSSASSGTAITIGRGTLSSKVTDFVFYLYIDGNIENNSNMMNKNLSGTIEVSASDLTGVALEIANLYNNASKTVVTNNSIEYNYANIYDTDNDSTTSGGLMNDRLGGTTSDYNGGNIRYYGANPSNYVYFNCETYPSTNCELWRIIGVFDRKIKLIRNEDIGGYSWDTSASTVNVGYGVNEWSQSDAMKLLNPGYENESVGGSLYFNSENGTCYRDRYNATKSCDFTSTGLKNETTRNMIAETTWNTGGHDDSSVYPNQIYTYERGENVVISGTTCSGSWCNDGITRSVTWTGRVALMYPSDYGYATDFNSCTQTLFQYDNTNCKSNDWLLPDNNISLLTPPSSYTNNIWCLRSSNGRPEGNCRASAAYWLRPTLYLNPSVTIVSGDGTEGNPYRINA